MLSVLLNSKQIMSMDKKHIYIYVGLAVVYICRSSPDSNNSCLMISIFRCSLTYLSKTPIVRLALQKPL